MLDPETGEECPPASLRTTAGRHQPRRGGRRDRRDRSRRRASRATTATTTATAERFREGAYWSGDLAYRDADGWLYFAGRSNEWLRVDGENFSAGPVESIIGRHPDVRSVAVYAVPDDPVGDRVMVALELWDGASFDPRAFDQFLAEQPDLGPKWVPAFVRVDAELPKLASLKIDKKRLRTDAWRPNDVVWRPGRGEALRDLTDEDRDALAHLLPTAASGGEAADGRPVQ